MKRKNPIDIKKKINHKRCNHNLKMVDSITLQCTKCGAGWMGGGVARLKELYDKENRS